MTAMMPPAVRRYLHSRSPGCWRIEGCERGGFAGAVVIPALAEEETLGATLRSLSLNPPEFLARFLILVVVNHGPDAAAAVKAANRRTLEQLADRPCSSLSLAWVDAASPGREMPQRSGGVGLARRIGFDLALERLAYSGTEPLLISLDADTLVRSDYLETLQAHFADAGEGGAVIPFLHQKGKTPGENRAIETYELFLRHYVLGLSLAGSPYAYHTVGSAMACRATAYVRAGGMNRRRAGEDFYFLQQLARIDGVATVRGTVVYPSGRPSHRTPFGTGRCIERLLAGEENAVRFYRAECFSLLGAWLEIAAGGWQADAAQVLDRVRGLSEPVADYLNSLDFARTWERLQKNHRRRDAFLAAFHGWFDALKTLRFIHHLCAGPLPRTGPAEALPPLLRAAGLDPDGDAMHHLARLRRHQVGGDTGECRLYEVFQL